MLGSMCVGHALLVLFAAPTLEHLYASVSCFSPCPEHFVFVVVLVPVTGYSCLLFLGSLRKQLFAFFELLGRLPEHLSLVLGLWVHFLSSMLFVGF